LHETFHTKFYSEQTENVENKDKYQLSLCYKTPCTVRTFMKLTEFHETHGNEWRSSIPNFVQICQYIYGNYMYKFFYALLSLNRFSVKNLYTEFCTNLSINMEITCINSFTHCCN